MPIEDKRTQLDVIVELDVMDTVDLQTIVGLAEGRLADADILRRVANTFCCAIMVFGRDLTPEQYAKKVRSLLLRWHVDKNGEIDQGLNATQAKYTDVLQQLTQFLADSLQGAQEGLKADFCKLSSLRFS